MLESAHSSFQFDHLHVQSCFLSAESSYLLLESSVLLLLVGKMSLDVLFNFKELVSQSLSDILSLKSQVLFKHCFVLSESNYLAFVKVELFLELSYHIL